MRFSNTILAPWQHEDPKQGLLSFAAEGQGTPIQGSLATCASSNQLRHRRDYSPTSSVHQPSKVQQTLCSHFKCQVNDKSTICCIHYKLHTGFCVTSSRPEVSRRDGERLSVPRSWCIPVVFWAVELRVNVPNLVKCFTVTCVLKVCRGHLSFYLPDDQYRPSMVGKICLVACGWKLIKTFCCRETVFCLSFLFATGSSSVDLPQIFHFKYV